MVVGGAHPDHWLPVPIDDALTDKQNSATMNSFLEECVRGQSGNVADEIKVCVLVFQNVLADMCPYLVLCGWP